MIQFQLLDISSDDIEIDGVNKFIITLYGKTDIDNNGFNKNIVCHIEGFPSWQAALQFEWAWKFYSRKLSQKLFPLERRRQALDTLLALERPTSKAITYDEWPEPIKIVWENE